MEQIIANGLYLGAQYALIALGLTLIFSLMNVLNFAHGQMYVFGGFITYSVVSQLGMPFIVGLIASAVTLAAMGALIERFLFRTVIRRSAREESTMLLAAGIAFFLDAVILLLFGEKQRGVPKIVNGVFNWDFRLIMPYDRILIGVLAVAMIVCFILFMQYSKAGRAMRALAQDRTAAQLMGVDVDRYSMIGFALGAMLAGLVGALLVTITGINLGMGGPTSVKAFMMIMIGGAGVISGAIAGGFILGMMESVGLSVLSSFGDNITTTLVTVALIQSLQLDSRSNIKLAVLAVFSINSGGAALITGDVTTLMIFTAGKVGISDLFAIIVPGLIGCLALALMLMPGFEGRLRMDRNLSRPSAFDVAVAIIFLGTILLTLAINLFIHVPPLLVFMFGLSLVFLLARFMRYDDAELPIIDYIRKIEFDTLLFFLGILLIVGMLREIGALNTITDLYHDFAPTIANFLIGALSAMIDNVPLTAAVLKSDLDMPLTDWLGFTYAVGVGGSLLAIGSAAGVLMMSKIEGLGFISYLRYTPHLTIAFSLGYILVLVL